MKNESKHTEPIDLLVRYFANEAQDTERVQLEQWRDASDENRKKFNAFANLWNLTDKAKKTVDIDIEAEWMHLEKTISKAKGKVISFARAIQIAASIIVVFGLTYLLYTQNQNVTTKTKMAQVQTIGLPDGSVVTINAHSKLSYSKDFGRTNREISLRGEAFFNVAKNQETPFVINAQGATIKVVGTQFNVKAYKEHNEVKVSVVEGTVEFFESKQPTKHAILTAGETGVYLKKQKDIRKQLHMDNNDISWKTNSIIFENTSLHEVAQVLMNVYHIEIEVSETVKDCSVTVEFNQKDLTSVLRVLKSTLDLTITEKDDRIIINGDGC